MNLRHTLKSSHCRSRCTSTSTLGGSGSPSRHICSCGSGALHRAHLYFSDTATCPLAVCRHTSLAQTLLRRRPDSTDAAKHSWLVATSGPKFKAREASLRLQGKSDISSHRAARVHTCCEGSCGCGSCHDSSKRSLHKQAHQAVNREQIEQQCAASRLPSRKRKLLPCCDASGQQALHKTAAQLQTHSSWCVGLRTRLRLRHHSLARASRVRQHLCVSRKRTSWSSLEDVQSCLRRP